MAHPPGSQRASAESCYPRIPLTDRRPDDDPSPASTFLGSCGAGSSSRRCEALTGSPGSRHDGSRPRPVHALCRKATAPPARSTFARPRARGPGKEEAERIAVWEYEVSGKQVLVLWFSYHRHDRSRPIIGKVTNRHRIEGQRLWGEPARYGDARKLPGRGWGKSGGDRGKERRRTLASGPVRLIWTTVPAMALDGRGGVSRRRSTGPGCAGKGATSWCGETDRVTRWSWSRRGKA